MTTIAFTAADMLDRPAATATGAHFGINLVAHALPPSGAGAPDGFAGSVLAGAIAGLQGGSLRYPGGTVTELLFDPANENARLQGATPMIAQAEAIAFAARTGASLDLVLQTRSGFDQTAVEALREGTYGQRAVSAAYLAQTRDYVARSLQDAAAAGVQIASLEIGNEFFYSGEMTASEYGRLAREVLQTVQGVLDTLLPAGSAEPRLLVQTLNAAGRHSPKSDTPVWILGDEISFEPMRGWQPLTLAGQGTAAEQARTIADEITGIRSGRADLSGLVDGLIGHDYNARGHRADGSQPESYMFAQFDRMEARLGAAPGSLSRHVTEWNARAFVEGRDGQSNDPAVALNRGLPHAALMVEMMFQFLEHGVAAAHVWPAYFPGANTTNLLDSTTLAPRLPGAVFAMMQESLVGLAPVFADHDSGPGHELDSYGYAGAGRLVLFVSSRLAAPTAALTLDIGAAAGADAARALTGGHWFVARTELAALDPAGRPTDGIRVADARPLAIHSDGHMARGDAVALGGLGGYGTVRIEVTFVGAGDDRVQGRSGDDRILGLGGDDSLLGDAGHDLLEGGAGHDRLEGGAGDDRLAGGAGQDSLDGGYGRDRLAGGAQRDWLAGGEEDDLLSGGDGPDRLRGEAGNDRLYGGDGADVLDGGIGRDRVTGGGGDDLLAGGGQADVFVFADGFGTDRITDFRRSGADRIDLSGLTGADAVTGFADVQARLAVAGDDRVIVFAGGQIVIEGMADHALVAADFLF